jgi:hypothetical protein
VRACEKCNAAVRPADNFCGRCGQKLPPVCRICGSVTEPTWACCMSCGAPLGMTREWRQEHSEAENIHWLAQARRRLVLPVESTEEVAFVSFEYCWKVINRLYNFLDVPRIRTSKGREREPTQAEKVLYLFRHYQVTDEIIRTNQSTILKLCDCVLSEQITCNDIPPEEQEDFRASARKICEKLKASLTESKYDDAATTLVDALVQVRNARVHASITSPTDLPVGGAPGSGTRGWRAEAELPPIRPRPGDHYDYEIKTVAEIALSIGEILLRKKTQDDIDDLIWSRVIQLSDGIYATVMSWHWKQ